MKILAASILLLMSLSTAAQTTIYASDTFIPPSQTTPWIFHNGYGDTTSITVWVGGPTNYFPANTVFFSYDKSSCRAYWQPGTCGTHLDFALVQQPDGSYVSTASMISFPFSCSWCGGWTLATLDIQPVIGEATPYLIIPAKATSGHVDVVDTDYVGYWKIGVITFNSVVGLVSPSAPTHWRTMSYIENVATPTYNGPALISEQWEGTCFDYTGRNEIQSSGCAHEKWYFAPGHGLVKVQVFQPTNDRNLDMVQ